MIFTRVTQDENYDIVKYLSKDGRWSLGLKSMMFGVRVRCGLTDAPTVDLDLCAGSDPEYQLDVLRVVTMILLPVPESITPTELAALFPTCRVKPIVLDECWDKMIRLAEEALQKAAS
jgi:hypothetical protein